MSVEGNAAGEQSQKTRAVIDGVIVDLVYRGDAGIAVSRAVTPVVRGVVTGGSTAGVSLEDVQQATVDVVAVELSSPVASTRSTIAPRTT